MSVSRLRSSRGPGTLHAWLIETSVQNLFCLLPRTTQRPLQDMQPLRSRQVQSMLQHLHSLQTWKAEDELFNMQWLSPWQSQEQMFGLQKPVAAMEVDVKYSWVI